MQTAFQGQVTLSIFIERDWYRVALMRQSATHVARSEKSRIAILNRHI
jgi:hypothetical protein